MVFLNKWIIEQRKENQQVLILKKYAMLHLKANFLSLHFIDIKMILDLDSICLNYVYV